MKYAKATAAVLGSLSPAALVGILAVFHVNISPELIGEIFAIASPILAGIFTARGPANKVAAVVAEVEAEEKKAAPAVAAVAPVVERAVEDVAAEGRPSA